MKKFPISVCMISGAEAHRIRPALESVAAWAGEIIVVLNAEVADGTAELALSYGAKVFREPWKGHVAQKNSAAAKASQPWVLGLDADEVLSPALQEEIRHLLAGSAGLPPGQFSVATPEPGQAPAPPSAEEPSGAAELCAAYSFPRCTFYLGRWIRHGDWYPDRQTRLWQRGRAEWRGNDPHDKLVANGPVGRLRGELLHNTSESLAHTFKKTITYAESFARHCQTTGKRVSVFDLLARPAWRFFRGYLLRFGFLDGWQGAVIAWTITFYTFLRYAKVMEAERGGKKLP
jgi:glycosyltransferase involved in cell wall biosynthesis